MLSMKSTVLAQEEANIMKLVYYVGWVLQGQEFQYSWIEKFMLALITIARKLWPYFLAHPFTILTDQPLR